MMGMLTVLSMNRRLSGAAALLAILYGCAATTTEKPSSSDGIINWGIEAPLVQAGKTKMSADARALSHFIKGQLLIQEGAFDDAIKEFEAAARAA